jgi:cytochrome c
MKKSAKLLLTALLLGGLSSNAMAQDVAKGEKLAKQRCTACHEIGDSGPKPIGPSLNGVIGRQAGTAEGFKPSKLAIAAGEADLVWTEELVAKYLPDPKAFVVQFLTDAGKADEAKGAYKMPVKFKKEEDNRDIAAYLATLSAPAKTN